VALSEHDLDAVRLYVRRISPSILSSSLFFSAVVVAYIYSSNRFAWAFNEHECSLRPSLSLLWLNWVSMFEAVSQSPEISIMTGGNDILLDEAAHLP